MQRGLLEIEDGHEMMLESTSLYIYAKSSFSISRMSINASGIREASRVFGPILSAAIPSAGEAPTTAFGQPRDYLHQA